MRGGENNELQLLAITQRPAVSFGLKLQIIRGIAPVIAEPTFVPDSQRGRD